MNSVTEQLRDVALRKGAMKSVSAVVVKQVTVWLGDDTSVNQYIARLVGRPCDEFDYITTDHPFEDGYIRWGLIDKGQLYIKLEGIRGL